MASMACSQAIPVESLLAEVYTDLTTLPHSSAADFAAKWRDNARRERASSQEHFIDLCRLLGMPTPNEADPTGDRYTFEAGAERTSTGKQGWAGRLETRPFSAGSTRGAHADLAAAYRQLLDYREALENPPLLVVSDMERVEVHTNFTNTRPAVHIMTLADLAAGGERSAEALRILRAVMSEPEALRPKTDARRGDEGGRVPLRGACPFDAGGAGTNRRRSLTSSTACSSASSPRMSRCSPSGS